MVIAVMGMYWLSIVFVLSLFMLGSLFLAIKNTRFWNGNIEGLFVAFTIIFIVSLVTNTVAVWTTRDEKNRNKHEQQVIDNENKQWQRVADKLKSDYKLDDLRITKADSLQIDVMYWKAQQVCTSKAVYNNVSGQGWQLLEGQNCQQILSIQK